MSATVIIWGYIVCMVYSVLAINLSMLFATNHYLWTISIRLAGMGPRRNRFNSLSMLTYHKNSDNYSVGFAFVPCVFFVYHLNTSNWSLAAALLLSGYVFSAFCDVFCVCLGYDIYCARILSCKPRRPCTRLCAMHRL